MGISVNVSGETAVNVSIGGSTGVSVVASGGIGPAGFITVPGTATNAFGTFQLVPGDGITVSTTEGQFQISSYPATAVSGLAPVQNVQGRTGSITISRDDLTAAAAVHTHGTADISGLTAAFSQVGHTHDASAIQSGTLSVARIPTIGYTALSGVPTSFSPSAHTHSTADVVSFTAAAAAAAPVQSVAGRTGAISLGAIDISGLAAVATSGAYSALSGIPVSFAPATHTHSTSDISGYQGLPAQSGASGPLVTDGTNATWTSRYSIVSPVLVQGAGMTFTRDTAAGEIVIAFAGGTSGISVGSATPLPLGVASAGTAANASREDHVHDLPTIGYTALAGVPTAFTPASHTHDSSALPANVSSVNGITGTITIASGGNVTVSTAGGTITIAAAAGGGGGATPAARSLHFFFRS